ncbi:glycosyltransferase family 4 protein [Parasphingorhabdus sp.]
MTKRKVLIFNRYFLPGYKAGGPPRTLANMISLLSNEFDFYLVTLDRDLGDENSYPDIEIGSWIQRDKYRVIYLPRKEITYSKLKNLIRGISPDVVYLNSLWDMLFTIRILFLRRLGILPRAKFVLAIRGQLSDGAMSIRARQKQLLLKLFKIFAVLRGLVIQISSEKERVDFEKQLGADFIKRTNINIMVAENISMSSGTLIEGQPFPSETTGRLNLSLLGRVAPIKNIDFAIETLKYVRTPVDLEITGLCEDQNYWQICQDLVQTLPDHVTVNFSGPVSPAMIPDMLNQKDLFFSPTKGENYGHAIAEALGVGLPVLISDQTPWIELDKIGVGWDLPIDDPKIFAEKIDAFSKIEPAERRQIKLRCLEYATEKLNNKKIVDNNRRLF